MAPAEPCAVCVGHAALDLLGAVDRWPGPDAKLRLRSLERQGGGPAATAAVTLRRLGVSVRFAGVVGDDDVGEWVLSDLRREGINVAAVRVRRGRSSHLSLCAHDPARGTRNVLWHPGTAPDLRPRELPRTLLDGAGVVLFDGRHGEASEALAGAARRRGIPTLLDAGSLRDETLRLVRLVDACVASTDFARELAGSGRPRDMLRAVEAQGPSVAAVTLGARGALARERGGPLVRVPALRMRVVDTTGAGDAFHGAFAWGLLQGRPLAWTLRFASVVAGLKCRAAGGRRGLPTLREALRRMR
ncbi:MAG: sugar kinase [Deltaproteobacteria bacterium]|nr:sugar kinase [Deltaproteobacteria bacterium]